MNPQDFESIISGAAGAGHEFFENAPSAMREAQEAANAKTAAQRDAINQAWRDFAETDGGKLALEALFDVTIRRTVFFVNLGLDPNSTLTWGCFREGQNAVAATIAKCIADGRGEPTKPRDTI